MNILANAHIITVIYGVRVRRVAMSKEGGGKRGGYFVYLPPPYVATN